MSNLILTIIHNYDYPFIEPFIASLNNTDFNGDLVIFASETISKTTKKTLKKKGVILIEYNSVHPFKPEYANVFENILPSASISNYRFVFYLEYLLANPVKYENVMLTDIRDVIFQSNPFSTLTGNYLNVFLEDPSQTFRSCQLNYQWSTAANGKQTTDGFLDAGVSCAGVTIGAIDPVIKYLKYMKNKLEFRDDLPWAFDQGLHNGYVYSVQPPDLRIFTNDDPFVATLGAYQPYKLNEAGNVLNSKGEVYALVHQYDRSGKLMVLVKRKYIGNRIVQKLKRLYYMIMP